jgi:hypothetical protein
VKLRLHGTRPKAPEATRRLVQVLDVVAVSPSYPDPGARVLVRVYLQVRLPSAPSALAAPTGGAAGDQEHQRRLAARDGPAATPGTGEVGG